MLGHAKARPNLLTGDRYAGSQTDHGQTAERAERSCPQLHCQRTSRHHAYRHTREHHQSRRDGPVAPARDRGGHRRPRGPGRVSDAGRCRALSRRRRPHHTRACQACAAQHGRPTDPPDLRLP